MIAGALAVTRPLPPPASVPRLIKPPLTTREMLMLTEFARALPHKVDELLDRCADPLTEDRPPRVLSIAAAE